MDTLIKSSEEISDQLDDCKAQLEESKFSNRALEAEKEVRCVCVCVCVCVH